MKRAAHAQQRKQSLRLRGGGQAANIMKIITSISTFTAPLINCAYNANNTHPMPHNDLTPSCVHTQIRSLYSSYALRTQGSGEIFQRIMTLKMVSIPHSFTALSSLPPCEIITNRDRSAALIDDKFIILRAHTHPVSNECQGLGLREAGQLLVYEVVQSK